MALAPDEPELVLRRTRKDWPLALLLLLPSLVVFGVFVFYPLARTIWLGFQRSDPFGNTEFIGISQYKDVLTSHPFLRSLTTTFKFVLLTVPAGLLFGLGLAMLGHQQLRGIRIYRTIFSSTVATSVAVASLMWLTMLNPSIGIVNQVLEKFGHDRIIFLQSRGWALLSVAAVTIWQNLGFTFIVISAGLQSVPDELIESARMDGAGPWERFRHVTLPMLSPTLLFAIVVLTINAFQTFGQIDLLTTGGPLHSTEVLVYHVFQRTTNGDPSTAAVEAVVLFFIILTLTFFQLRFLERRVFYGE
jgi:sn-glycerol 3-phosphate transport system permease protein